MPTILSIFGLRVVVYLNDHRPAHVHVIGNGHEAVFNLHCPHGPPQLRENYGFSRTQLTRVSNELDVKLLIFCDEWKRIHDYF